MPCNTVSDAIGLINHLEPGEPLGMTMGELRRLLLSPLAYHVLGVGIFNGRRVVEFLHTRIVFIPCDWADDASS